MALPVLTPASVVQTPNSGGTSATLNIPISASGNDRLVFIAGVSKDNSSTVNVLSTMVFDATGVNRSVGLGINQVTARQIAQEGNYSSQSDVYLIKEADLPSSAGTYAIDITMDGAMQYLYWIAFEVTGCNQTLDAIAVFSSTANVAAGGSYSQSITTTVADCLVIDFWGQSDSAAPTITPGTGQTQIGSNFSNTNGGGNCSYKAATTVGSYNMSQTTTTLSQRQAGIVVSIAPVGGAASYSISGDVSVAPAIAATSLDFTRNAAIDGAVSVSPSVAATLLDFTRNAALSGAVTISPSVAAAMLYGQGNAIVGDVSVSASIAAAILHNLNRAIAGDVSVASSIAAAMAYTGASGAYSIAGNVTVLTDIASAMVRNIHPELAGSVDVGPIVSGVMDYTLNASIGGSVTVPTSVDAGMSYNVHPQIAGSVAVNAAISAAVEYVSNRAITGDVAVTPSIAAALDYTFVRLITGDITVSPIVAAGLFYSQIVAADWRGFWIGRGDTRAHVGVPLLSHDVGICQPRIDIDYPSVTIDVDFVYPKLTD